MAHTTTDMPPSGWWQVELAIEDDGAATAEQAAEVLNNTFAGLDLAIYPVPAGEPGDGLWLVELPDWAIEALDEQGWIGYENGPYNLETEMP